MYKVCTQFYNNALYTLVLVLMICHFEHDAIIRSKQEYYNKQSMQRSPKHSISTHAILCVLDLCFQFEYSVRLKSSMSKRTVVQREIKTALFVLLYFTTLGLLFLSLVRCLKKKITQQQQPKNQSNIQYHIIAVHFSPAIYPSFFFSPSYFLLLFWSQLRTLVEY